MKIYILGSKGMLGSNVTKYLQQKFKVVEINRNKIDASKVTEKTLEAKLRKLDLRKDDVVINCMGTIKPRVDQLGDLNGILVNSVFPRILANAVEKIGAKMIHPTTDCVYFGLKGKYSEDDKYDVHDMYGMSKALGEPKNCTVIRTSIIGEEVGQARSLVEWVKSSTGKTVSGFTNHYWNGVTCLQFAKICEQIINKNKFWQGTKHVHSNTLSKKELVEVVSKIYKLNVTVTPTETPAMCDRTLSTVDEKTLKGFKIPPLEKQIKDMKGFSKVLYEL
jgi:dTDP-4-dehydrorhamnose reductase